MFSFEIKIFKCFCHPSEIGEHQLLCRKAAYLQDDLLHLIQSSLFVTSTVTYIKQLIIDSKLLEYRYLNNYTCLTFKFQIHKYKQDDPVQKVGPKPNSEHICG